MRKLSFFLMISVLALSCTKNNNSVPDEEEGVPNPDNSMFGEWKYTENYISPGTLWHWVDVENGGTLKLNEDFSYTADAGIFSPEKQEGKFDVNVKVIWGGEASYFLKQGTTDTMFFHPITVKSDTLELAGFCIEGCIHRFRKVSRH